MRLYSIGIGLLIIGSVVAVGPTSSRSSVVDFERAIADLNVDKPLSLTSGCVGCGMCSPSPTGPHSLTVSGQLQVYPGDEHFGVCLNHNCMEFHYFDCECGGEGLTTEEQKALWTVATGEGIAAIVRALDQYPDALKLNLHHGSLQLYNCLGDIAASIPMRPNQLAELELELARSSGH